MIRARDIMTAEVVTVEEYCTLREAIEVLAAAGVTGAPVVAGATVVGVASMTDILDFEAGSPGTPAEREGTVELGEWDGVTPESEEVDVPATYFVERWLDSEADAVSRIRFTDAPEWDRLDEHSVAEVMSRKLVRVGPEAPLQEVADRMIRAGVHRILVMEDAALLGVVTTLDIVRAVAEARVAVT